MALAGLLLIPVLILLFLIVFGWLADYWERRASRAKLKYAGLSGKWDSAERADARMLRTPFNSEMSPLGGITPRRLSFTNSPRTTPFSSGASVADRASLTRDQVEIYSRPSVSGGSTGKQSRRKRRDHSIGIISPSLESPADSSGRSSLSSSVFSERTPVLPSSLKKRRTPFTDRSAETPGGLFTPYYRGPRSSSKKVRFGDVVAAANTDKENNINIATASRNSAPAGPIPLITL